MRGKRKRENEGHDFRPGHETKELFEGGEGKEVLAVRNEIEADTHV